MKGIGTFVVLLLVGIGAAGYVVTRPPDRELDATERAWVAEFNTWRDRTEARVDNAEVRITLSSSERRNSHLVEPLRGCSRSLARLGTPSELLTPAYEAARAACGQAEHAVRVNDRFGRVSLATTKLHLNEAGDRLRLAEHSLRRALGEATT